MKYLKKKIIFTVILTILVTSCVTQSNYTKKYSQPKLNKPESIIYDSNGDFLYVSNINGSPTKHDGNGFISKLNKNGEIIDLYWLSDLDAPKGLFLKDDIIYCTDINKVYLISTASRKVLEQIDILEAKFLNDIIVTDNNSIIASDTKLNTVFIVNNKEVKRSKLFLKNANGLDYNNGNIYIGANGNIYNYDILNDSISIEYNDVGNIDGLKKYKNKFYFTNFYNKLSIIDDGKLKNLDVGLILINSKADFCILNDETLVVPDFNSRIIFYKLNRNI